MPKAGPAKMPFAPGCQLQTAGDQGFFVIHHTDCSMQFFSNDVMRGVLASSLETAELTAQVVRHVGRGPGSHAGDYIDWLTVKDPQEAVVSDVARIRTHPCPSRFQSTASLTTCDRGS
jgi:carbonic anhydrase